MAEWIRSHDVWLHCTTIQMGLHSKPGAGTANQAIHPSGVGKSVAVSIQWMTTVEGCDGKKACNCTMAGMLLMQPTAQTIAHWFPGVCMGVLEVALAIKSTN